MPAAPTGTITFLFTDIEGSTVRWDRDRDAMRGALARHDTLLREAIVGRGGFVFKTVGDAFCAAFETAPSAANAALDAQRALQTEDFSAVGGVRVRMAIHSGTAQERDADYFGPAVNRVARLLALGYGGQVLVSRTAADLLQAELPPECSLRDLGEHQLKDLTRSERVYQLIAPDVSTAFPALRSVASFPNNLPPQLTSFVGREEELAQLHTLVHDHRLVSLVGAGGAGKTRCAIAVGAESLEQFRDGVWLVELAAISDPQLVPAETARTLGIRETPNRPLETALLESLERQELLLMLDNCEHVIEPVRSIVAAILRGCSAVRVLCTSRENLGIAGERAFRMPSLAVPPAGEATSAEAALRYDAVALFADRAQASNARFALTDREVPVVIEIAQRLDGIPLAIELAAARINVLSPRQLAQKLNERFRVLTGGDRSALPRHQTMRALIDWSYDLLSEDERRFFRKLSIFAGGFTLEGAAAVCGEDPADEIAALELLTSLVDKSLVQVDAAVDARYRLLESTRQYAREKLDESGEYDAMASAHARAFLALAERLDASYNVTPDVEWFGQVEPELENWRAALDWTLTAGADVLLGQRLAAALGREWAYLVAAEGRRWIDAAQAKIDATTPLEIVARLDLAEAQLDGVLGLHRLSFAAAERALEHYRALEDPLGIAQAQRHTGRGLVFVGRVPEGEALLHEALAAFRSRGEEILSGAALENLALARHALGDLTGARKYYADALAIFNANGAERLAAAVATNLAEAEFRGGDPAAALRLASAALETNRTNIFTYRVAFLMSNMAAYLVALGRYDEARLKAREALEMARDVHYDVAALWAMQHLAAGAALEPHHERERAARVLGYVDARLATLETHREYTEQREYDMALSALREALGADRVVTLMDEGRGWNEDQATAEATLL